MTAVIRVSMRNIGLLASSSGSSARPRLRHSGHLRLPMRSLSTSTSIDLAYERIDPPEKASPDSTKGPLVIVHGLFGSKQNWRSLSKAFAKNLNRPVYALDLRNHGQSPHNQDMTYTTLAEDVLKLCQKLSLSKINLLGHSLGGKVVMALALNPSIPDELLEKLIVVDMSPARGPISGEYKEYIQAMKQIEAKGAKNRREADAVLQQFEKDVMIRQFLLTNLEPGSAEKPQGFRIPLDLLDQGIDGIGDFPYEAESHKWNGKTLFVKGSKSKYINRRNIPIASAYFPHMELATIEAGHWVHVEKPADFLNTVSEFILHA